MKNTMELENIALRTLVKELSDALLTVRPLGGSECFTHRCGNYYADPSYFKKVIAEDRDDLHEARISLMRWQKGSIPRSPQVTEE